MSDEKHRTVVYIGPAFHGLASYSVFAKGRYPFPVQELIKERPHIVDLMVPISELQNARKNIKKQGHILHYYLTHLNDK